MRLLELFSGTHSVSNALSGYEVISIDILNTFNPTEVVDIMNWNYKKYPTGYFDVIWASPPCTQYSTAKTKGKRDIHGANQIVQKTLEIISYFKPIQWFIENPQTGKLKEQEFMKGLHFIDVDYCQYGFDYRKRTRIWSNQNSQVNKLCDRKCHAMIEGRHRINVGSGLTNKNIPLFQKYAIPPLLIQQLIS